MEEQSINEAFPGLFQAQIEVKGLKNNGMNKRGCCLRAWKRLAWIIVETKQKKLQQKQIREVGLDFLLFISGSSNVRSHVPSQSLSSQIFIFLMIVMIFKLVSIVQCSFESCKPTKAYLVYLISVIKVQEVVSSLDVKSNKETCIVSTLDQILQLVRL